MRVPHLFVENLGPLERIDLDLRPVTVLMGPNEAGKSFLLDALGVLRFGTCRGIAAGESSVLTRGGAKGWAVEATIEVNPDADPIILRRTRSTGPDVATLDGAMGDARVWRALLDGRRVLTMKPDERKGLVADLLARDTSDLVEALEGKGAPKDVLDAVRDGNLRRAFRLAEEDRRAFDRALTDNETIIKAGAEDPEVQTRSGPKPISTVALAVIDDALRNARAKWRTAVDASSRAAATAKARADADEARAELARLGAAPTFTKEAAARLAELGRMIPKKSAELETASQATHTTRAAIAAIRDRLAKADAVCPVCTQTLGDAARSALEAAAKEHEAGLVRYGESIRTTANDLETMRKEQKGLEEKATQVREDERARSRFQARIDAAGDAAAPTEAESPEPLEQEVRRLELLRETRVRYDGRAEALANAVERARGLREQRDAAAEIEKATTPDRMDDEEAALKAINDACAEYGPAVLAGPGVRIDSTWEVTYGDRRIELASDSAQLRAGLVLALALSRLAGVKCVFVDRLEALDDGTRAKVVNLLGDLVAKGEIETAIVATVRKEPPAPSASPDWLGRVWIEGGRARVL